MQKNQKNNGFYYLITLIVLALIIITFSFGYYLGFNKRQKFEKYVFVSDTIKIVKQGKIIKILDTIKISDTLYIPPEPNSYYAEIDTTFKDSLYLNVKYYHPTNIFSVKYKLPNRMLVDKPCEDSRFSLSIGGGLLFGSRGIDYGVYFGISYNLKFFK